MPSSAHRSPDPRVQPSRLVSIDSRRHIPKIATRTRIGVGDQLIDHAAGKPLSARQSFPGIPAPSELQYADGARNSATGRHYVIAPVAPNDWEDQPKLHDRQRMRDVMDANEAPVDLPLRSRTRMYFALTGLVVAFIAMLVGTFFAGASSQVRDSKPEVAPAQPANQEP